VHGFDQCVGFHRPDRFAAEGRLLTSADLSWIGPTSFLPRTTASSSANVVRWAKDGFDPAIMMGLPGHRKDRRRAARARYASSREFLQIWGALPDEWIKQRLQRTNPIPARPQPRRASVEGSGTPVGGGGTKVGSKTELTRCADVIVTKGSLEASTNVASIEYRATSWSIAKVKSSVAEPVKPVGQDRVVLYSNPRSEHETVCSEGRSSAPKSSVPAV
jgi:hypothetical protein